MRIQTIQIDEPSRRVLQELNIVVLDLSWSRGGSIIFSQCQASNPTVPAVLWRHHRGHRQVLQEGVRRHTARGSNMECTPVLHVTEKVVRYLGLVCNIVYSWYYLVWCLVDFLGQILLVDFDTHQTVKPCHSCLKHLRRAEKEKQVGGSYETWDLTHDHIFALI